MSLRLLYFNVIERNAGWGAEWFIDRALRAAGHRTHCIDFRVHRQRLTETVAAAPAYDAVLIQRGDRFPLEVVDMTHGPRIFWASELLRRCRDQDHLIASGRFAHIFFHSGECLQTAVKRGWLSPKRCSVLRNGFDPEIQHPDPSVPKDIDVLFAGSITRRRRGLLTAIGRKVPLTVASAFGAELTTLVNRSRIVLNLHAEECPDMETRVFETLGCRGFLVTEPLSPENPFTEGRHYVDGSGADDLSDKLKHYLADEKQRETIADAGYRAALSAHTYAHRAVEIAGAAARCLSGADRMPAPPADLGCYHDRAGLPAATLGDFYDAVARSLARPAG